jgi:uncharacterized MAPEG superfamily protein
MSLKASSYFSVVANGISVCAVKLTLLHLLTARERLRSENFPEKNDPTMLPPLRSAFSLMLGSSVGPSFGGAAFIDRCQRIGKNIAENETMFFLLSLAYGTLLQNNSNNSTKGHSTQLTAMLLVQVYTASRVAHTLIYLTNVGFPFALRGFSWVVGSLCSGAMVALTMKEAKSQSQQ